MKREYRRIDSFLKDELKKIQGIRNVENQGDVIVLTVSVECIDTFLSHIFSSVKAIIGEKGEISIGEVYLKNRIRFFDVHYMLNETAIVNCKIPIIHFSISEDLEKFKIYCRYKNVIVKNMNGVVQDRVFILLLEARNGIESINEQIFQINKTLEYTDQVNTNEMTLDRIDKSYQMLIKEIQLGLSKVVTIFEENGFGEQQYIGPITEVIDVLLSYKRFIMRSMTDAQELYASMGKCLQKINALLGVR